MRVPGECRFFGQGGMTAEHVSKQLLQDLKSYGPNVVFVNIGANDIRSDSSCRTICQNIHNVVLEIYKAGANSVFVAEISERGCFVKSHGLTNNIYMKQKNSINRNLKKMFGAKLVKFPEIRFPEDYGDDLVHFSNSGNNKYFYRIRRIFLSFKCNI